MAEGQGLRAKRQKNAAIFLPSLSPQPLALSPVLAAIMESPFVTDHAVLRFLERSGRVDVEQIRTEILTDDVKHAISILGDGRFPVGPGLKAVVSNGRVVTVVPSYQPRPRREIPNIEIRNQSNRKAIP
jgi:hypothetical protein